MSVRRTSVDPDTLFGIGVLVGAAVIASMQVQTTPPRRPVTLYPLVAIKDIPTWKRPRAAVVGKVTVVRKEDDGDWHVRVEDAGGFVICEIIPELPLPRPTVGDHIRIQGVVRYDGEHGWYELHPVTAWQQEPAKQTP